MNAIRNQQEDAQWALIAQLLKSCTPQLQLALIEQMGNFRQLFESPEPIDNPALNQQLQIIRKAYHTGQWQAEAKKISTQPLKVQSYIKRQQSRQKRNIGQASKIVSRIQKKPKPPVKYYVFRWKLMGCMSRPTSFFAVRCTLLERQVLFGRPFLIGCLMSFLIMAIQYFCLLSGFIIFGWRLD